MEQIKTNDKSVTITDTKSAYYECPSCHNKNITRVFNRCIDCNKKITWRKEK